MTANGVASGPLHAHCDTLSFSSPQTYRKCPSFNDPSATTGTKAASGKGSTPATVDMTVDMNSPAETILASEYISPPPAADTASSSKPLHRTIATWEELERKWLDQRQAQQSAAAGGVTNQTVPIKCDSETCPTSTEQSLEDTTARVGTTGNKRRARNKSARGGGGGSGGGGGGDTMTQSRRKRAQKTPPRSATGTARSGAVPGVIDVHLSQTVKTAKDGGHRSGRPEKMSVFERLSNQSTVSSRRKRIRERNHKSNSRSTQSLMTTMATPPARSFDTASLSTLSCADSVFDRLYRNQRRPRKYPHATPGSTDTCAKAIPNVDEDIDDFSSAQARVERRLNFTPSKSSKRRPKSSTRHDRKPVPQVTPNKSKGQVFDRLYQDSARVQANRARTQVEMLEHSTDEAMMHAASNNMQVESKKEILSPLPTHKDDDEGNKDPILALNIPNEDRSCNQDPVLALNIPNKDISCIDEVESAAGLLPDDNDDDVDDDDEYCLHDTKRLIGDSMELIDDFLDATNQLIEDSMAELIEEAEVSAIMERAENMTFASIEKEINRITHLADSSAASEELKSILLIQKQCRGYLARRRFASLLHNSTLVPWLMHSALSAKQHSESRGDMISRYYLRERSGLNEAVPLQRLWRGGRSDEDEAQILTKQVVKIQSAFRGYAESLYYQRLKESSASLQSIARGYLVRKRVRRITPAAVAVQSLVRGYNARWAFAISVRSVVVIQAWSRGIITDRLMRRQAKAAEAIQATWRGYITRGQTNTYVKACIHLQSRWRSYRARRISEARKASAILLQSIARQLIARARYEEHLSKARAIIFVQSWYRMLSVQRKSLVNQIAAVCIQRVWRGQICRATLEKNSKIKAEKAAPIIQSWWRGHCTRRSFTASIPSVVLIQTWMRGVISSLAVKRHSRAARLIQSLWRGYAVRKKNITYVQACIRVQTRWRTYRARQVYRTRQSSAILLQSIARKIIARARYEDQMTKLQAVIGLQSWVRGMYSRRKLRVMQSVGSSIELKHLISVQSFARMVIVRQRLSRKDDAARCIQVYYLTWKMHKMTDAIQSRLIRYHVRRAAEKEEWTRMENAALSIQKRVRGYHVRRKFKWSVGRIVMLQAWSRSIIISRLIKEQSRAAETIQATWRGYVARKRLAGYIQAGRRLQTSWRSYKARLAYVTMKSSALLLQSIARQRIARACYYSYLTKARAANVIQRWARGLRARKKVLVLQGAVACIQRVWRSRIAREQYRGVVRRVILSQTMYRSYRVRRVEEKRRMGHAASIIQRTFRGYKSRRLFVSSVRSVLNIQAWIRRMLTSLMIIKKKQSRAAETVQRAWRGYAVRKEAKAYVEACVCVQTNWRVYRARCAYVACLSSAIIVQAEARRRAASMRHAKHKDKVDAVVTIQRTARGIYVQRKLKAFQDAAVCIQRISRAHISRRQHCFAIHSTTKIQSLVRMYQVRANLAERNRAGAAINACARTHLARKRFMSYCAAAIVIQRTWRGASSRRFVERLLNAVCTIQTSFRRYFCQLKYRSLLRIIILLQASARGLLARINFKRNIRAASIIQRVWQDYCTVSHRQFVAAVVKIQSSLRAYSCRSVYKQKKSAAIAIQSASRVRRARREARQILNAVLCIHRACRSLIHSIHLARAEYSATLIQASYRTYLERAAFVKMIRCATTLQAWARSVKEEFRYAHTRRHVISLQSMIRRQMAQKDFSVSRNSVIIIQSQWRSHLCELAKIKEQRKKAQAAAREQQMLSHVKAQVDTDVCLILNHEEKAMQSFGPCVRKLALQLYASQARAALTKSPFKSTVAVANEDVKGKGSNECLEAISAPVSPNKLDFSPANVTKAASPTDDETISAWKVVQTAHRLHRATAVAHLESEAALLIQSKFRSHRACKVLSASIITAWSRRVLSSRRREVQIAAAKTLQCAWRGYFARTYAKASIQACILLQAKWRAYRAQVAMLNKSALKIQTVWRGYSAEIKYQYALMAIVCIQSAVRRHQAASKALRRSTYLLTLQCMARQWLARRQLVRAMHLSEEEKAFHRHCVQSSIDIQRMVRGSQARTRYKMHVAARQIQKTWRGYVQNVEYMVSILSAITIQTCARTVICRKRFQAAKRAIVSLQGLARGSIARASLQQNVMSATRIQSWYRGMKAVDAYRKYLHSVVTMQSTVRGMITRRAIDVEHYAASEIQRTWRGYDANVDYVTRHHSAILLQSMARQHLTRARYVDRLANARAAIVIQRWALKLHTQRALQMVRHSDTATCIQRAWRGHICRVAVEKQRKRLRRRMVLKKRRMERAAIVIQSWFRVYCARRSFAASIRSVMIIQAWSRLVNISRRMFTQKMAAETIQNVWRSYAIRKHIITYVQACIRVQTRWRTYRARQAYVTRQSSAILLQSIGRHLIAQAKHYGAVSNLRVRQFEENGIPTRLTYIIRVQSFARMVINRQRLSRANDAARCIQVYYLTWKMHKMTDAVEWAALTIQRAVRSHLLYGPTTIQDRIENERIYAAVLVIQRFARRQLAKRKEGFLLEVEKASPWSKAFVRFFGY